MQTFLQFALGFLEPALGKRPAPRLKTRRPSGPTSRTHEAVQPAQLRIDLWGQPEPLPTVQQMPGRQLVPYLAEAGLAPFETLDANANANTAALPLQTLQQALAPVTFRHPQASREMLLGDTLVAYAFARGKRRTIGFSVGPEGLAVRAPKGVALHEVEKAVLDKSSWILKKLQEARQLQQRQDSSRMTWTDGASILLMGRAVTLVLEPTRDFSGAGAQLFSRCQDSLQARCVTSAGFEAADSELFLHIGLPHAASGEQIRDAAQAWLMRQARAVFSGRLSHFAPVLKVQWRKFSLSSAGTRWGSATTDGSIRLNWRLIHFRLPVIDYVVVHELSHLRVMNHSPQFWETVCAVVPDYRSLRDELKGQGMPRY